MLPADIARCPGARLGDGWLSDCKDCARRTSPPPNPDRVLMMEPPEDVLWSVCVYKIDPDTGALDVLGRPA